MNIGAAILLSFAVLAGCVFGADLYLSSNGSPGVTVYNGGSAQAFSGTAISSAGDVNGDHFDDYLIGARGYPGNGQTFSGAAFLVFGSELQSAPVVNLTLASLSNDQFSGTIYAGATAGGGCGSAVAKVGRFNADLYDDFAISCTGENSGKGVVYVLFGSSAALGTESVVLTGTSGQSFNGFRVNGLTTGDYIGSSLAGGGDINDDGHDDLVIGAMQMNNFTGGAFVVFGRGDVTYIDLFIGDTSTSEAVSISMTGFDTYFGYSLAVGDVNGDTVADVLIGAPKKDIDGVANTGAMYVLYGGSTRWSANRNLGTFTATSNVGYRLVGSATVEYLGVSVRVSEDLNDDGRNDVLVLAPGASYGSDRDRVGICYVMYGRGSTSSADLASSAITSSSAFGYRIVGPGNNTLASQFSTALPVGDQNEDGVPDIALAISRFNPQNPQGGMTSTVRIVNSAGGALNADVDLASYSGGNRIIGPSNTQFQNLATAGDVDGDGVTDVLIGAPFASAAGKQQSGLAFLLLGGGGTFGQGVAAPQAAPSAIPSAVPSAIPSTLPSFLPSIIPSAIPSAMPSAVPSSSHSMMPTPGYTAMPTVDTTYLDYVLSSKTFKARNLYAFAAIHPETREALAWGAAKLGGNATSTSGPLARIVGSTSSFLGITTAGALVGWGMNSSLAGWTTHSASTSIVASSVVANAGAYAGITTRGAVFAVGSAAVGGNVESDYWTKDFAQHLTRNITAVVASDSAFAALTAQGNVYTWGSKFAAGGVSSDTKSGLTNVIAIYATTTSFACLLDTGGVTTFGDHYTGGDSTLVAAQLTDVVHIIGAKSTFAAFRINGSLVTWGHPTRGGDSSAVADELASGVMHVVYNDLAFAALKVNGTVVTWGEDEAGGDSSVVQSRLRNVTHLYATGKAFAALTQAGAVVAWGASSDGGVIPSTLITTLASGVRKLYATRRAFAALKSDGSVHVWGNAYQGGATYAAASYLTSHVTALCANEAAFTAVRDDGRVVMWGHMTVLGFTGGMVVTQNAAYANITACA